jgi:hypothetical protein
METASGKLGSLLRQAGTEEVCRRSGEWVSGKAAVTRPPMPVLFAGTPQGLSVSTRSRLSLDLDLVDAAQQECAKVHGLLHNAENRFDGVSG